LPPDRVARATEGEFLPGGRGTEWCDSEVLRLLRRPAAQARGSRGAQLNRAAFRIAISVWAEKPR
jgi:ATP-dependent Lhr-like helicase